MHIIDSFIVRVAKISQKVQLDSPLGGEMVQATTKSDNPDCA